MNNSPVASPATVLVVDDDPATVATFVYALRATGRRVLTATNGHDAIRHSDAADVVVCDLKLPDISGLDVCRAFRQTRSSASFVMITGFGTIDAALEAGRLGASQFLEKPIDIDDLVKVVDEQLRQRECQTCRTPPSGYEWHLARITEVIERDFADSELTVTTVARRVGLSKQHVCRVFKSCGRRTFAEFLLDTRLCEARRLLEQPSWTVKEVASRVGFHTASHLARAFRRVLGISPSEYRRQCAQSATRTSCA